MKFHSRQYLSTTISAAPATPLAAWIWALHLHLEWKTNRSYRCELGFFKYLGFFCFFSRLSLIDVLKYKNNFCSVIDSATSDSAILNLATVLPPEETVYPDEFDLASLTEVRFVVKLTVKIRSERHPISTFSKLNCEIDIQIVASSGKFLNFTTFKLKFGWKKQTRCWVHYY